MKTLHLNPAIALRTETRMLVCALSVVGIFLLGLAGCADTHWQRAVYQGARYGSEQCQIKRIPTDAPCAQLGDYDRYTEERTKARNTSPPSTQGDGIEEVQR